ncbi:FtsK/SpoIIIE domain-containing protein [Haloactinomyces albus]|uniref:S-DNA-T family DNA segregation ATPase FtsK/SpoIIIE n=1 Tax=Haloactinomyces albus TaxID=1352928 RepID=A0AAE3ZDK0_9ACTN|nr:FtsK/SpoIIIE domain-containing protein [Haloactinomyces albus]MDR7301831.1 S-DNA-T family DNA segregation ATPase FtsK/SpoIIIE [Haloactinomyces albus]MDR7304721.1 S-DNA-T family DNA segregation ATPase FtsK/SpoIIIE [Haloactinomyces albus]
MSSTEPHMGDLIRFPQTPDHATGNTVPAPRHTEQTHQDGTDQSSEHDGHHEQPNTVPGTTLAVDTPRALQRLPRPALPPALARTARTTGVATRRAAGATWRVAKPAGQVGLRHGAYTLGGTWELTRRGFSRLTHGDLTEAVRAAKAAGDLGMVAELEQRRRDAANDRWKRITAQVKLTGIVAATGSGVVVGASLAVLIAGVVVQLVPDGADFAAVWTDGWWAFLVGTAQFVAWVASLWPWMLAALVATLGYAAWRAGHDSDFVPAWISAGEQPGGKDVVPDEGAILDALRNLNLPPLNKAIKEGWKPRWVQPTGRDGRGWRTQLELPQGVTVEKINDNKDVLAHNLVRKRNEVWPTEPRDKPGVLDLWVADQGILSGPVDVWPLLEEGTTDYFTGVPVGIDARGDEVTGKLMAANYVIGGTMGSGKTSLVVNLLLGAILDPLVEIDVHVMAYNVDFDPLRPRLRSLVKGDEDEQIEAALDMLRELREEVTQRGKILDEIGGEETKLTRDIAEQDARMRPRLVVVDECQELFEHDEHGKEAKELAEKVAKKARKTGITLVWATPSPSAASLPRDLAKTASHRVCFAIGDHQGSDAVLGTGKHKAGITATGLVPGEDVGTAMATGFRRDAGLVRCHHIRKEKGIDEITPVVQRALALREDAGITANPAADRSQQPRDLLADLDAVLGTEPVPAADVPALLARHAPKWAPYQRLTGKQLRVQLTDDYGIKVPSTGNKFPLDPATVRSEQARRATADLDTEE